MLQQLRTLARGLRRAPAFTAAAVLCVALGIGANTAIFSAVSAVLLRPVATPDVDRLVAVRQDLIPIKLLDIELAPPEVLDLAERRELFASVAGFVSRGFVLEHGGTSTRFEGVRTLGDYFGVFRVRPHHGRLYTADDSRDGRHQVAVLTYGLVYGVGPRDPVTLLAGAGLLGAAALLASWIPARRAARSGSPWPDAAYRAVVVPQTD